METLLSCSEYCAGDDDCGLLLRVIQTMMTTISLLYSAIISERENEPIKTCKFTQQQNLLSVLATKCTKCANKLTI